MAGFKGFLVERVGGGGAEAGKFEVVSTPLDQAKKLVYYTYHKNHTVSPANMFSDFDRNYQYAQQLCKLGKTLRKDMPVIRRSDAFMLQRRLARGALDIREPWAKGTDKDNPFPEGLSGIQAQRFLTNGFRDGSLKDDVVSVSHLMKPAGSLKPIQHQIYLDKALTFGNNFSSDGFKKMVSTTFMISSKDNFIIDGHHRWLFAVLVNPRTPMLSMVIDLPLEELLPLLLAYGDSIENKRNK